MLRYALVVVAIACVLGCVVASDESAWLTYEPTVVDLTGQLGSELHYGPPNYGEDPDHDAKVEVLVLTLTSPVAVRGDVSGPLNRRTVENIKKVQLIFGTAKTPDRTLMGERVRVRGTLSEAESGHHYTDVVLSVRGISKVK